MKSSRTITSVVILAAGIGVATAITFTPADIAESPSRGSDAHTQGSTDAEINIVEFSDLECPFCARLHPTLARAVGESPNVSWEYRHFPLPNHANAKDAAIVGECIGKLAGNTAFWEYVDTAFTNQRVLGESFYESERRRFDIAEDVFGACRTDPLVEERVRADYDAAVALGGNGTPFVVIVYADGSQKTFTGALPYEQVRKLLIQDVQTR